MSGIKDVMVTMTRTERDRLLNSARRAEETREQAIQRERLSQNALNAANMKLKILNRTLNNEIAGLHDDMRSMANEQNRRLMEQAANFNGAMADLKVNLEAQMERNRQSLQDAINKVQANIQAKENNHRKQAEFWVKQTEIFFTDIEQYRHDLFTPNRLQKLRAELSQTSSDMRSEAFQAAISSARNVFNQAAELKEIVVNAEIEWNFYYKKFQEALADARSNLDYRKTMQFTFATEDGDETVNADINYWTEKALDRIEEKLAQIKQRAAKPNEISTDELKEMTAALRQINAEIETAEAKAKEALVSSQFRAEMASKLGEVLMSQGWTCNGSAYEDGEYNGKVHVKLSDIKGNEIVAVISPDENMVNNIEINFFNMDNDEGFRQMQLESIHNSLKEDSGLNIGEPVCRKGYETRISDNYAIKDIQATAAKKAQTTQSAQTVRN
jgi:hypothetical protein